LSVVVYSIIGLAVFGVAFFIMTKISPISIRKEIEEDQNVALAILMGSIFLALAIIIQAAIRG
jgi:putative membrane protein